MKREILVPEYFYNFSCIGASCEDTCCAGWDIIVDKETFEKYNALPKSNIKDELKKNVKKNKENITFSNFAQVHMDDKKRCSFLTGEGWCKIHTILGNEYLCNTCAIYPRTLNQVDGQVEKSLTTSCPEAARLILLNKEGINFIEDEEDAYSKGLMNMVIQTNDKPFFWALRIYAIQILQNRNQSIEKRLIILGLFFQKLLSFPEQEWIIHLEKLTKQYEDMLMDNSQNRLIDELPKNLSFQMNMAKNLVNYRLTGGIGSHRYIECINDTLKGLELNDETEIGHSIKKYEMAHREYYIPFMKDHEYILENYAVNYIFKNLFPYDQPNLFESYVMLVVHMSMIKMHLVGIAAEHRGLTEELVVKLIQSYSKVVEHSLTYLKNVREMLNESGYSTMAHMVVLIKS